MGEVDNNSKKLRFRLIVLGAMIMSILFVFSLYLFNLQIINNLVWKKRAEAVSRRSEKLIAQRGFIWDTNYDIPLAVNHDSFAVQIVPAEIQPLAPEILASNLTSMLDIEPESILQRIPEGWRNSWNPIEIFDGAPYETIVQLAESVEKVPGIHWQSKPSRFYNAVGSISHVLGYVGHITNADLQVLYNQGYENTDMLGKTGIEDVFDATLRGKSGKIFRTVDIRGRQLDNDTEEVSPPVNGNDIVLTIDRRIQMLAEKALGPRKGAVVVLKPTTGEILAMVSYPSFDPNQFMTKGPGSFTALSLNKNFPFLNRAIQSTYAPASTFKLIMTAALLGEKKFNPYNRIECRGSLQLGNRTFWCWKRSGHGYVNLAEAIAVSCNIYFGTIGVKYLGVDLISEYARLFGLGDFTGIDLNGEAKGIVPDVNWKQKAHNTPWVLGDTLNMSVGQGFLLATPLQMANVIAAIVNNGVIYRPHILKEIRRSGTGTIVERVKPEVHKIIDRLDDADFQRIQDAMRGVVASQRGTARWVMFNSVGIAGKTGTAEIGVANRWNDWFVSYGPYSTPDPNKRVVVVVLVEASDSYDWWAPKATDIIFEGIFSNKNYETIAREWKDRKVWWSGGFKSLPKPGWPYRAPLKQQGES